MEAFLESDAAVEVFPSTWRPPPFACPEVEAAAFALEDTLRASLLAQDARHASLLSSFALSGEPAEPPRALMPLGELVGSSALLGGL